MSYIKKGSAVALGTFDGIHKGHLAVLRSALDSGFSPIAVTFRAPPKGSPCILTAEDKLKYLKELGFDETVIFEFSEIKDTSPEDFLNMLKTRLSPKMFCCGFNYRFGKNAEGDTDFLARYCKENGIAFSVSDPVFEGDRVVSSTAVRSMIANGETGAANRLLYKPFGFSAEVVRGDRRGRLLGFPTVNQHPPKGLVTPRFGVYATKALLDGRVYNAVTNFGIRPTFKVDEPQAETFIFDADGDFYGKNIRLYFVDFLRPEKRFSSPEELEAAVDNDKKTALAVLSSE